ncbi:multidrug effflux MFS transporter [Streptomyces formicae]|uniref:Putative bicyclomycin resistance protein n=1 Tax=Streptomyces formicae TaxID=1616117 RepID=A0A291QKU9_9ACTN|nr:multidrug effflux MFS transporter [Streptomyces formicae]ATL32075.1 putative bicyclomycin resistance protein [Streptomyces formicae]
MTAGRTGRARGAVGTAPKPGSRTAFLTVIAALGAVGPLATDMYVSALPDMARSLGTGAAATQATLTAFLLGVIAGQLVLGPLSDLVGRRPVLLYGTAAFAVFSFGCACAPTIEALTALRFGQGVAGAAGIVVGRAVIVDSYRGIELSRAYATLSAIGALGPVLAPVLGGGLLSVAPWRFVFIALALAGAGLTLAAVRVVPESLPRERRVEGGAGGALRTARTLLSQPAVLVPVVTMGCMGAAVFSYIAGATFILHDLLHLSATMSSVVYGVNALANLCASLLYGRLVRTRRPETLMVIGAVTALGGQLLLLVLSAAAGTHLWTFCWPLLITVASFGFLFPAVSAVGQGRGRTAPGTMSALLGVAQFSFGAAASPLIGLFGTRSAAPMAVVMSVFLALTAVGAISTWRQPS